MHEAGIVRELIRLAGDAVPPGTRVREVHASVGRLTGVSPHAMRFYFEALRDESLGSQAELRVRLEPLLGRCGACGATAEIDEQSWLCPSCGEPRLVFENGDELDLVAVVVDDANLITIEQKILKKNADIALENRREIEARGAFAVGLVSAPGSGKTSLLERTLQALAGHARCAVVEGDVQTDRDARRIAALDVPVVQIVTNGTCHLEARMVQEALPQVPSTRLDLIFIENVGNLVCPASYELGEHLRVVVMSTPEGEDKPLKYPALFRKAHALVLNKIDLIPHLSYDAEAAVAFARRVNPDLALFRTSCTTGQGIEEFAGWLLEAARARMLLR